MAVNLIVSAITLLMAVFVFVWVWFPHLRALIEAPKYRVLAWREQYPEVVRPSAPPAEDALGRS